MPTAPPSLPADRPRIVEVAEVVSETPVHVTVAWDEPGTVAAGQFAMVWIPGVDEVPMSYAALGSRKAILARGRGEATKAICALRAGDRIGVRGPYGRPFTVGPGRHLAVGGGTGLAPILPLIEANPQADFVLVIAAKTRAELVYLQRAAGLANCRTIAATDDGSAGEKGMAPEVASRLMEVERFGTLFTCGPERMMRALLDLARARGTAYQGSLERFMKCGVGFCDACSIGGWLVCRDGPVLDGDLLAGLPEFGAFHRDAAGRPVPI